jgi:hypothetical protein
MIRLAAAVGLVVIAGTGQARPAVVAVNVWTTSGLPVYEIDCNRFELRLGAADRRVMRCTPAPPLTIAVLFDVSGSFSTDIPIRSVVEEIAEQLRDGDRMSLGWFGGGTELPIEYTRDVAVLKAAAERAQRAAKAARGPSPLWDALAATVRTVVNQGGRTAAVVFTDARATGNQTAFGLSALEIVRSGVEIHAIGAPSTFDDRNDVSDRLLRLWSLARASGGTASRPGGTFQYVRPVLRTILGDLQRGFLLEFEAPPGDTGVQPLSVRIATPGFVVRAPDRFAAR